MSEDNLVYNVSLAEFLLADKKKTRENIRSHTITLVHNGESHTINDSLYYEVSTKLFVQYLYICHTMKMDDSKLIQTQKRKSVREVLADNEAMIAAHK